LEEVYKFLSSIENEYVRGWKNKGGKVIGYACVATTREIIEAAGMLPYRIKGLGEREAARADAYLSRFNCAFCRSCLDLALRGEYDFLDGVMETNGCDHMRGMFENWNYVKKPKFSIT